MARFDPNAYPDRLVFEAHARHLRAGELGRIVGAVGARLRARTRALAARMATSAIGATIARHSQPVH